MCGLVALASWDAPVSPVALARATAALRHRGPDAQGQWVAPHGRVGLGHARLSIVGLDDGAQPLSSESGTVHAVVNGEFYDFERIRAGLRAAGHRFRTGSDSEIALHLYEDLGRRCLEHLRGEFALVLWDERSRSLFAARDRFGVKPLFYARAGGVLYLASEAKALFAAGLPAAWDQRAAYRSLLLCLDPEASLFHGVRQVPPGHCLLATAGGVRVERYWDVDYPRAAEGEGRLRPGEYVEQARHLVQESVRLRLRADVPVGCLLSGGLDSSATLGVAARHADGPVAAFTVSFRHPDFDEAPRARRTAEHVGARFTPVSVGDAEAAAHFEAAVWHGESVLYNAHAPARFLLSRVIRDAGYKTVLSGEGADEAFAGYHFCSRAVLARPAVPFWLRLLAQSLRPRSRRERAVARVSPWLARVAGAVHFPDRLMDALGDKLELFGSLTARHLPAAAGDPYRDLFRSLDARGRIAGREPVKQILYLWIKSVFANYVLAGERLDMAHGVEVRLPFLDHVLFEWARRIPAEVLANQGRQKWVLREAARPFITDEVYGAVKHGFMAPPATLRPGDRMSGLVQDLLRGRALESVPFLDRTGVVRLLDRLPALPEPQRAALDPILLMTASLCVLQQRYRL